MKKNFTQIPNMVIKSKKLPDNLFRTYAALRSYAFGKNKAFPSQQTLANDLGKTRETINRHIVELTALGFISKRKRGYSLSNEYDFCDELITNEVESSDKNITPRVLAPPLQKLRKYHTNNTNNKTTKNIGDIEVLRKKMKDLRLKNK